MDTLLKYKDLMEIFLNLISIILIFIVSWKGLDTINKYQSKKNVDLIYQNKLDLIKQTNQQLHEFNLIISEIQPLFVQFNNEFTDFESEFNELEYGRDFSVGKFESLNDRLEQLKITHIQLKIIISKCYLLESDFIDEGTKYAFFLSDYLYGHSKVLKDIRYNSVLPYEIDLKNEYFQTHYVFQEKLTDPIFNLFSSIKENIKNYRISYEMTNS